MGVRNTHECVLSPNKIDLSRYMKWWYPGEKERLVYLNPNFFGGDRFRWRPIGNLVIRDLITNRTNLDAWKSFRDEGQELSIILFQNYVIRTHCWFYYPVRSRLNGRIVSLWLKFGWKSARSGIPAFKLRIREQFELTQTGEYFQCASTGLDFGPESTLFSWLIADWNKNYGRVWKWRRKPIKSNTTEREKLWARLSKNLRQLNWSQIYITKIIESCGKAQFELVHERKKDLSISGSEIKDR